MPGLAYLTYPEACSVCLLLFGSACFTSPLIDPIHPSTGCFYPEARVPPSLRLAFVPHVSLVYVCLWVGSSGVVIVLCCVWWARGASVTVAYFTTCGLLTSCGLALRE